MSRALTLLLPLALGCAAPALLPEDQMASLGNESWQQLLANEQRVEDPEVQAFVQRVAERVIEASELRVENVDVAVLAGDQVNAFALPGGHIGVYEGLLSVAENGAGLATVIAHEVAHITEQHANERMSQKILNQIALVGAGEALEADEDRQLIMQALGVGAQVGITLPYSRSQESEADMQGLDLMARAGYVPSEAVELWERMRAAQPEGQPPSFLSTHPATEDRIEDLQENLPEAMEIYRSTSPQYGIGEPAPAIGRAMRTGR